MNRKTLRSVEFKEVGDEIQVEALFATLDVKDHDGDVTLKGAFASGAPAAISAYNHASWGGVLPVGKGRIFEEGNNVVFRGTFFDTAAAQDTRKTLKGLGDLAEWSYGFDVDESEQGEFKGENVRFLKRMTVHEVSPVMKGAGIGTRTLSVKRDFSQAQRDRMAEEGQAMADGSFPIANREDLENAIRLAGKAKDPAAARRHIMRRARALDLEDMIPEDWQKMRFSEHGEAVLADLKVFGDRAAEVMAKRLEKEKALGEESHALVEQIKTELKRIEDILTAPKPDTTAAELEKEWLRFTSFDWGE